MALLCLFLLCQGGEAQPAVGAVEGHTTPNTRQLSLGQKGNSNADVPLSPKLSMVLTCYNLFSRLYVGEVIKLRTHLGGIKAYKSMVMLSIFHIALFPLVL